LESLGYHDISLVGKKSRYDFSCVGGLGAAEKPVNEKQARKRPCFAELLFVMSCSPSQEPAEQIAVSWTWHKSP